ncbi:mariner Mos1 transposase-like Protein [Trichonephila inaurata madagascariensis]|uniref:Mariner Mos1 transposase-like Protein n=1 Tax=Trichonephila inaurata madagascariensis TaxID=2747483 RepID=A0A8X6YPG4_9ARAC|nr:mariner Mos1 transposase-like Protein [Trichonephila inaurata madagascariensis]
MGPLLQARNESKQRVEDGVSVERNAKSIASAGNIISSVFWETKGTLLIDYLEKSKSITSEYYSNPLDQLDAKICKRKKEESLEEEKSIFLQDNATAQKGALATGKLWDSGYDLLGHSPYSHDLAPSVIHERVNSI